MWLFSLNPAANGGEEVLASAYFSPSAREIFGMLLVVATARGGFDT